MVPEFAAFDESESTSALFVNEAQKGREPTISFEQAYYTQNKLLITSMKREIKTFVIRNVDSFKHVSMIIDGPYLVFLATVNDGMKALASLSLSLS